MFSCPQELLITEVGKRGMAALPHSFPSTHGGIRGTKGVVKVSFQNGSTASLNNRTKGHQGTDLCLFTLTVDQGQPKNDIRSRASCISRRKAKIPVEQLPHQHQSRTTVQTQRAPAKWVRPKSSNCSYVRDPPQKHRNLE